MNNIILKQAEMENICPGEALTIATVMTILLTAIIAVIVYRLFKSSKGNVSVPGGFKFQRS